MGVTESVLSGPWVSLMSASYYAMAMAVLSAPAWLLINYLVEVNLLYY